MRGAVNDDRPRGKWSSRDKREERDEGMAAASTWMFRNGRRRKNDATDGDDQRRQCCRASRVLSETLRAVSGRGCEQHALQLSDRSPIKSRCASRHHVHLHSKRLSHSGHRFPTMPACGSHTQGENANCGWVRWCCLLTWRSLGGWETPSRRAFRRTREPTWSRVSRDTSSVSAPRDLLTFST
jgi:hypothetical protein